MSWDIDSRAMMGSFVSVLEDIFLRCEKRSIGISFKVSQFSIVDIGGEIPPDLEKLEMDWTEKFPENTQNYLFGWKSLHRSESPNL